MPCKSSLSLVCFGKCVLFYEFLCTPVTVFLAQWHMKTRMVQLPATAAIEYVAAGHFFPGGLLPGALLGGGTFGQGDFCFFSFASYVFSNYVFSMRSRVI